jgi:long-subunit fatty acid transport protein
VKPGSRLQAGVVWRTETTLDGDFSRTGDPTTFSYLGTPVAPGDTSGSLEITYPNEVAFGAAFYPRAKLLTAVRVDVGWTEWSAFRHGLLEDLNLDNVWDARVGIEHIFYNDFAARLGFRYTPSPQNDEIASSAFTFGGGLDLGALHADLAFEVGSREYRFDDLFDDSLFGGNARTQADLVEESTLSGFLTMSYGLDGLFQ